MRPCTSKTLREGQFYSRMMAPREAVHGTEPKGKAKTLRQKDRSGTTLRKGRRAMQSGAPKGQPNAATRRKGISRGKTEAERHN